MKYNERKPLNVIPDHDTIWLIYYVYLGGKCILGGHNCKNYQKGHLNL
jgi:hypothetical protein